MSPRAAASPGKLPRSFWFIWTALLVNKAAGFVVIVMMLYLTSERSLAESQAGIVVGLFGVGGAAGVLIGGVVTDNLGRKFTMVTSSFLAATALVLLGETTNLSVICVLVAVFGFANAALGPAAIAAIADVVEPQDRDRAFNLMFWAMNLGMGAATLLAGFLAQYSYLLLFRLDALGALATGLIVLLVVPETLKRTPKRASGASPVARRGRFIDVWRDRPYLIFVALVFLQATIYAQTSTTLPLSMKADGLSESDYGIVLALGSVMVVGGQLLVPRMIRRFSKAAVLSAAMAFMAVGFGIVGLSNPFWMYLVCAFVWTIGSMLAAPPNATVIAELSPAAMRGRYQGVFSLTYMAAAFAAPAIGGFTLQYLGSWHWAVIAGIGVIAATGHWLFGPSRERAAAQRAADTAVQPGAGLKAAPVPEATGGEQAHR